MNHDKRYSVVRYPLYYVVIDKINDNQIVFESRSRGLAWKNCNRLNAAHEKVKQS